ncbi:MAG: D-alanine--D-alanine ligase A [Chloroflexi bacterium]|nr:D-alanine--D-alanine ligase A [Chloroflexota bacterium]
MKKINIGIIFGGKSPEHSISIVSALNIINGLNKSEFEISLFAISENNEWLHKSKSQNIIQELNHNQLNNFSYIINPQKNSEIMNESQIKAELENLDLVFPCIHGSYGEDGKLQAFLENNNIKFIGNNSKVSELCYDKSLTKDKLTKLSIKQADFAIYEIEKIRNAKEEIINKFSSPFFIKPSRGGSSIGVHKINNFNEIMLHIEELKSIDKKIIIEEEIIGQEIECSVIGNKEPVLAQLGEIINNNGFYNFENKYENDTAEILIPANVSKNTSKKIYNIASEVYKGFELKGLARIDFFYKQSTKEIFLNEINTMPGFTNNSLFPKAWAESGVTINELIKKIIRYSGDNN